MTSTTTHGSHSSVGHTNHGSSITAPHVNHGSHNNTITSPSFSKNSHSASVGGVDWSSSVTASKLGVYGSSGTLSQLLSVANSIRSRVTSSSYVDNNSLNLAGNGNSAPSLGSVVTASSAQNLIGYAGATYKARYQPYTYTWNIVSGNGHGSHQNSSVTQNISSPISNASIHSSSSGASYHGNTSGMENPVKASSTYPTSNFTKVSGSKITAEDKANILTALKNETLTKWTGPEGKTFSFSGTNRYNHASHSSTYSSHASHSSHRST